MAGCAYAIGVAVVEREEGVVLRWQGRREPRSGRMASGTGGWPARCTVVRIRCSCIVRLVARIAGRRRPGIDVIYVALYAIYRRVRTSERERSVVVIERRSGPIRRCVTRIAGRRETCSGVSGVGCAVPIRLMAAVACGGQRCVVVVHMALCAVKARVRPGKREGRVVVIERRRAPSACGVANRAVGREP